MFAFSYDEIEGGREYASTQNRTYEVISQTVAIAKYGYPWHCLDVHLLLYPHVLAHYCIYGLQYSETDAGITLCRLETLRKLFVG